MKYLQPGGLFSTWGRSVMLVQRTAGQAFVGGKNGGSDLSVHHLKCGSRPLGWTGSASSATALILVKERLAINCITERMTRLGLASLMPSAPTAPLGAWPWPPLRSPSTRGRWHSNGPVLVQSYCLETAAFWNSTSNRELQRRYWWFIFLLNFVFKKSTSYINVNYIKTCKFQD